MTDLDVWINGAEGDLVSRLVAGDEAALAQVYDAYAAMVQSVATRVTRDAALAEDVTQEVFVALWRRPFAFDPRRGTLRGWLATVARRRAIDVVRREQRQQRLVSFEREGVEDEVMSAMTAQWVRAEVAALPVALREAVVLAYYRGHSHRQVAVLLGIPEGTAKSRLRLAMRRLAAGLRRHGIRP